MYCTRVGGGLLHVMEKAMAHVQAITNTSISRNSVGSPKLTTGLTLLRIGDPFGFVIPRV